MDTRRRTRNPRSVSVPFRVRHRCEALEPRRLLFGDHTVFNAPADPPQADHEGQDPEECIDFEDLKPAARFVVGDRFVADNAGFQAAIRGEPFTLSDGQTAAAGSLKSTPTNGPATTVRIWS